MDARKLIGGLLVAACLVGIAPLAYFQIVRAFPQAGASGAMPGGFSSGDEFVSYNERSDRAIVRFLWSVSEDGTRSAQVMVIDDYAADAGRGRNSSDDTYSAEDDGAIRFALRTWKVSGEEGHRQLVNTDAAGADLWGTYYEDEDEAREHPFVSGAIYPDEG